jgi:hypothetical protein
MQEGSHHHHQSRHRHRCNRAQMLRKVIIVCFGISPEIGVTNVPVEQPPDYID